MFLINKKGSLAIEIVIGMMVFLSAMALLLDIFLLTWQINEVSTITTYVSKIAANQGGINRYEPIGWNDEAYGDYYQTSNIHRQIDNLMSEAKVKVWRVEIVDPTNERSRLISSDKGYGSSSNLFFDYGEIMVVKIQYEVGLNSISRMLPKNRITKWSMSTSRTILSDYKERFDGIFDR